jgi:glycosyltransferase involved in cell wall biosynthesis
VSRGINLIGHLGGNLGLGVAARNTAALLESRGDEFVGVNVLPRLGDGTADTTWESRCWTVRESAPHGVNLFHLNPPEVLNLARTLPPWLEFDGRTSAIVPFWELPYLPEPWRLVIQDIDLVLAPTRFIEEAVRRSVPTARVVHFPQTVSLPPGIRADRTRWGFGDNDVVFVVSFDLNSDPARKNPHAVIAAFEQAFAGWTGPSNPRLVIRLNNVGTHRSHAEQMADLRAAAADPRITLDESLLSFTDVLSLYASADVYVSLHRSEGLGLGLLESMMLGTPVLATGYSGNMDFMTADNSALVGYDLVPVSGTNVGSYSCAAHDDQQVWAEPRVGEAAEWMRLLASDAGLRRRLADAGQAAAEATAVRPERSAAIDDLLALGEQLASNDTPRGTGFLQSAGRLAPYWRARQGAIRVLRDGGIRL